MDQLLEFRREGCQKFSIEMKCLWLLSVLIMVLTKWLVGTLYDTSVSS